MRNRWRRRDRGGVATARQFLEADLVDTMHVAVAPIEFGRGERLWNSPDDLLDRFHLESVPSPSGVTHLIIWRR
jgi:dihydrofolate reductase